jgi:hypothetical protein
MAVTAMVRLVAYLPCLAGELRLVLSWRWRMIPATLLELP